MSTEEQGEAFEQPGDPLAELEATASRLERLGVVVQDLMRSAEGEGEDVVPVELDDQQLARYVAAAERIGNVASQLTLTTEAIIEERSDAALETRRMDSLVKFVSGQYFEPRDVKGHLVGKGLWDPKDRFTFAEWKRRIEEHLAAQGARTTWLSQPGGARILAYLVAPPIQELAEQKPAPPEPIEEDISLASKSKPEPEPEPTPESVPLPEPATLPEREPEEISPPAAPALVPPLFRHAEQESPQPAPKPSPKAETSPDLDPAFEDKELEMARGILEYLHQATPAGVGSGVRKRAVANEVRQTLHVPHTTAGDYIKLIDRLVARGLIQQDLIPPESKSQRHGKVLRPRRRTEMTIENMLAGLAHPHAISRKDRKRG